MPLSDDDYFANLGSPHLAGQLPAAPVALDLEGTDLIAHSDQDSLPT
jgi:hypothetical protein